LNVHQQTKMRKEDTHIMEVSRKNKNIAFGCGLGRQNTSANFY